MTLIAFDFQGVFASANGTVQHDLYTFITTPPPHTVIAIVSFLSHRDIQQTLLAYGLDLGHIHIYGHEDMADKAAAITTLANTFQVTKTIFVTDTVRDIQDVMRTDAIILAVSWGFEHIDHLQDAISCDKVCSDPKVLISSIESLL